MNLSRVIVALGLVMVAVLLAAGCVGPDIGKKSTALPGNNASITPTFTQIPTLSVDQIGKSAAIAPFQRYKDNMTEWQRKLPTQLLQIIDPNFPKTGNTPEEVKALMSKRYQLLYADEAIRQFDIQNTSSQPVGDHIYVRIYRNSSASMQILDSYITKINDRDPKGAIVAWVDLNKIEKVASLQEVTGVDIVIPGETN
jgi:hypothetical protein